MSHVAALVRRLTVYESTPLLLLPHHDHIAGRLQNLDQFGAEKHVSR